VNVTEALAMPRQPPRAARRAEQPSPVSNARLAILIVIAAEVMFFTGLVGAYIVFRGAAKDWPPQDLPRLPIGVTAANTVLLLASIVPMTRALRAIRADDRIGAARGALWTALLGSAFLAVQGLEWVRLVRHGLTLSSGTYGGIFYVLIGCHGLHVLVAVVWLLVVAALAHNGRFTAARHAALETCTLYWYLVCGLWAFLFPLVYLS
jgi:heme/copper-type cytochrome/quinol oxidase subunit 3